MALEVAQVDAFSGLPFGGNPAGICVLPRPVDPAWMQSLAAEMNVSETAFLVPVHGGWDLRWFTPEVEVELCGHATLAAAHWLIEQGHGGDGAPLSFFTASGELTATRGTDGWIQIDLPARAPEPATPPGALLEALGVADVAAAARSGDTLLVELPAPELVRALAPDVARLVDLGVRGVVVTSVGDGLYDVVSRYFAPAVGIDEDPVTGAAHCVLGPYWAEKLGKEDLLCYQASRRGGVLRVGVRGDRVRLSGQAVTVFRAELSDEAEAKAGG